MKWDHTYNLISAGLVFVLVYACSRSVTDAAIGAVWSLAICYGLDIIGGSR